MQKKKRYTMKKEHALVVAGSIFALVAVAHLFRIAEATTILFGTHSVPMYVSVIALIVSLGLSIWMFLAAKAK